MPQSLQERGVRLDPEHELTHRLEMRLATLELLGHRVDVPEPTVESAIDEDRGRAGGVMRDIGYRLRLVNRVGRGEPDQHALVHGQGAGAATRAPDVRERSH